MWQLSKELGHNKKTCHKRFLTENPISSYVLDLVVGGVDVHELEKICLDELALENIGGLGLGLGLGLGRSPRGRSAELFAGGGSLRGGHFDECLTNLDEPVANVRI